MADDEKLGVLRKKNDKGDEVEEPGPRRFECPPGMRVASDLPTMELPARGAEHKDLAPPYRTVFVIDEDRGRALMHHGTIIGLVALSGFDENGAEIAGVIPGIMYKVRLTNERVPAQERLVCRVPAERLCELPEAAAPPTSTPKSGRMPVEKPRG